MIICNTDYEKVSIHNEPVYNKPFIASLRINISQLIKRLFQMTVKITVYWIQFTVNSYVFLIR